MADSDKVQGEAAIIQEFLAPLAAGFPGAFGLLDDCAAFTPAPGHDLVVKTDPVAAGVHFFADDPAVDIAWKALAVNVSDLVAKTAVPRAYLMALSFPGAPTRAWMRDFATGLGEAQTAFGLHLVGGDTDQRSGPLTISITVLGEVPTGTMLRRGTAQAGDLVCVTGVLGDAALGLALHTGALSGVQLGLPHRDTSGLIRRYLRPQPDLAHVPLLRRHARAAMDISDGILKDLGRMCAASSVGAELRAERLPVSTAAQIAFKTRPDLFAAMISAGDDYEVLAAVPPEQFAAFQQAAPHGLTCIGTFTAGSSVIMRGPDGQPVDFAGNTGWDHF